MLKWIVGLLLIIGGLGYAVLAIFAGQMASMPQDPPRSVWIGSGIAVLLGIAIIVWG